MILMATGMIQFMKMYSNFFKWTFFQKGGNGKIRDVRETRKYRENLEKFKKNQRKMTVTLENI